MLSGSFKQKNLLQADSFFKSKQCLLSYHFLISHLWTVFVKKKKRTLPIQMKAQMLFMIWILVLYVHRPATTALPE